MGVKAGGKFIHLYQDPDGRIGELVASDEAVTPENADSLSGQLVIAVHDDMYDYIKKGKPYKVCGGKGENRYIWDEDHDTFTLVWADGRAANEAAWFRVAKFNETPEEQLKNLEHLWL